MTAVSKQYLLNGEPVTGTELIEAAEAYSERFANDWLKQTSVAASILRDHGHRVTDNPEYRAACGLDS
jgi:hypothetical protein